MMRTLPAATVLALALVQAASARSPQVDVRPRPVRWHLLPPAVKGAFVSRGGRCFYVTGVDKSEEPTVTDGVVSGGFRPVLLDRSGRLWCIRPGEERLFGVKGDDVVSAAPPKGASFHTLGRRDGLLEKRTAAWEDAAGRIWFGTTRGVMWTDGSRWHSKDLAHPDGLQAGTPMSAVGVAEDPAGAVYFWAPWPAKGVCGTKGFWRYDGKTWRQMTGVVGLDPASNRIAALCLIGPERLLVNTEDGRVAELPLGREDDDAKIAPFVRRLNHPTWAAREKATEDLIARGRAVELALKRHLADADEPEVRSRIRMVLAKLKPAEPDRPEIMPQGHEPFPRSLRELKGGRWSVRMLPQARRRRTPGRGPLAVIDGPRERPRPLRLIVRIRADRAPRVFPLEAGQWIRDVSALDMDEAGAWIGIRGRGLYHSVGDEAEQVLAGERAGFWRILGRDRRGRVLLTDGERVGAYWPGKPENPQETGDAD
ncbi:MAG: hypothetical protein ACOC8E_00320 [Planctomycetota bacterium]